MKPKVIAIILLATLMLAMVPQNTLAVNTSLPNSTEELLDLNNALLQKLCNTSKDVYQFGLGTYHCPDDIAPGSYIIYIFSNYKSLFKETKLVFKDASGLESEVTVGNLSMATIKVTVKDNTEFSLLEHDILNEFGVVCFIAPWTKIGE